MPIVKQEDWQERVDINQDAYGKCCVDVAREVMKLLDEREGDFDTRKIICEADENISAGGITGFMAGCVAEMVSHCHSRGEEFRKKWNLANQIQHEGEKANEGKEVLNPALLNSGCGLDDLIPCDGDSIEGCQPGYRVKSDPETSDSGFDWKIVSEKPEED